MLVLVTGALLYSISQSGLFAIQAIPMEWRPRLNNNKMEIEIARSIEADIGLRLTNVMGKRPWEIDLARLGNSIRALAWIEDVRLQRVFPDRLVVSITAKKPIAVVIPSGLEQGAGTKATRRKKPTMRGKKSDSTNLGLRPITEAGELMPEWTAPIVPDVPFLRGEIFLNDTEIRNKAVQLINALPATGVLDRSNIAEIHWNNGFSLVLLSPRMEIILGETMLEKKLARVERVLNYLSSQGKRARIVDSTSVKKVVVRPHHSP